MPEVIVRKGEPVDRALKTPQEQAGRGRNFGRSAAFARFRDPFTKDPTQGESQREAWPRQVPFQSLVNG